ncbi:MAG: cysteine desulfurase family protein [Alphaproteobacteria bacterium]
MNQRVYLDHNATSPLRPEARAALLAALACTNPSSVHREGQRARAVVERARAEISALVGAGHDVVFTSGGTEALSLAIRGSAGAATKIFLSAVEHPAARAAAELSGARVEEIPVTADGIVDLAWLANALDTQSGAETLVCVMAANHETGVIQPVAQIVALARDAGARTVVDAVQGFGKMDLATAAAHADMVAISAHKIGGPQGVGALAVRPGLALRALVCGGGQEGGRRGGTENVAGIAAFSAAANAACAEREGEAARLARLAANLAAVITGITPAAKILGLGAPRLANTVAFAVPGQGAEKLVIGLDLEGIAVSAGAACSSGKVGASPVLAAMGLGDLARSGLRLSLGWTTTQDDIDRFEKAWRRVAARMDDFNAQINAA